MRLLKIKAVNKNGDLVVDAMPGQHISMIIEDLLHLALDQRCSVITRVNGCELIASPKSSFTELLLDYDSKLERR